MGEQLADPGRTGSGGSWPGRLRTRLTHVPCRSIAALLIVIALFHLTLGETLWSPARNLIFDAYQRWMPRRVSHFPVAIIDIDDRSLAAYGRWPWPRSRVAELIERVHELGALAVGLDMIMPEADNLSPNYLLAGRRDVSPALTEALEKLPTNDSVLATALRKTPSVIARAAVTEGRASGIARARQTPVIVVGESPLPFLHSFPAELANIPELDGAVSGSGYVNDTRDRDGVMRSMPLVLAVAGAAAPSLAVEILRVAAGEPHYRVRSTASGVLGVQIGDSFVPTDADGRLRIHFSPALRARRISAAAILGGDLQAGALAHQVALVGTTAVGVADVLATPAAAHMDGVEIQAQLIENILSGSRLKRPAGAGLWELAALAVFALLLIIFIPRRRPIMGLAIFSAGAALLGLSSLALFHQRQELYDPSFPAAANGLIVLWLLTSGFATSERRQRELDAALETEKVERVRVAAELKAARDIQMGMLPDPKLIEGLPPSLDFCALLEPAQEVGGDLYDAFMLDDHRLFFMIGDVSGKGVPAALFMALTKTITKSLARRERLSLDRLMGLVNEEISRENTAEMFVSAIIGVIDGRSGEIEICNAGHNAPVLSRPGQAPREIDGAGGPPLCVDEEFYYPVVRGQLESGDLLIFITDGVSEAEDDRQAQYGSKRVLDCFIHTRPAGAAEACAQLRADVKAFTASAAASDDLTIMVIRFIKAAQGVKREALASPNSLRRSATD
jgi:adenylate cyclase